MRVGPARAGTWAAPPARCQLDESAFKRVGEEQPTGDAGEDQRDVTGAEGQGDGGEVDVGGALLEGGGEFLAVVDELAQAEEVGEPAGPIAPDAAGSGGAVTEWDGGRGRT